MSKTAIEELIEDFEAIEKDGYNIEPKAAIELCKQILEKQQIMDAHQFLENKGIKSMGDLIPAHTIEQWLNEFAQKHR